jgi:aryl-alcohol dehydrogenase-like predicted oxidoreductase
MRQSSHRLGGREVEIVYHHHWMNHGDQTARHKLSRCVSEGLARRIGLSNCAAWQAVDAGREVKISAVQFLYNLLKRTAEIELIPAANHFGWSKFAYSPLASGLLTGKYNHATDPGWRLCADERYRARYRDALREVTLDPLLGPDGNAFGDVDVLATLAWVMRSPSHCRPIIGARNAKQLGQLLEPITEYHFDAAWELDDFYPAPPPATDRSEEA